MLAEPRSREKYSVNPRGLDWSNDDNKLGQKLLEKMGWKKGNALGLRENGNPDPIKVSTKSDRRGVGCTVKNANNWIAHQDDFSSILAGLNEGSNGQSVDEESSSSFSLEQKSKNSRSRVHYQKFAKGKDLSRYETADLQSIFGQRQKQETADSTESPEEPRTVDDEQSKISFGIITVTSSTSMDSYFAQKMAEVKQRLAQSGGPTMTKAGDDGDGAKSSAEEAEVACADKETKRKKKKRRRDVEDNSQVGGLDELPSKKSEKKNKQETADGNNIVINDADDDSSGGQKKKHKKSKKRRMDVEESNDSVAELIDCGSEVLSRVATSDEQVIGVSDGESRVHKKSKKRSRDVGRQLPCESEINADDVDAVSRVSAKKEKSKRKHLPLQIEQEQTDCQHVMKRKKKKKDKSKNVDC